MHKYLSFYIWVWVWMCLCVCVAVSWQLKRFNCILAPYRQTLTHTRKEIKRELHFGSGYCNENLFKLENANCIWGLWWTEPIRPGRAGCGWPLETRSKSCYLHVLPIYLSHSVQPSACCLLSGAAEKGKSCYCSPERFIEKRTHTHTHTPKYIRIQRNTNMGATWKCVDTLKRCARVSRLCVLGSFCTMFGSRSTLEFQLMLW